MFLVRRGAVLVLRLVAVVVFRNLGVVVLHAAILLPHPLIGDVKLRRS